MRVNIYPLIKSCGTRTDPAAETKSIGLQADARVVMVFARHLDSIIVTRQLSSTYRDLVPSRQFHRDQWVLVRLLGLARPNDRNESAAWTYYSFGRAGKNHATAIRRLAERQLN